MSDRTTKTLFKVTTHYGYRHSDTDWRVWVQLTSLAVGLASAFGVIVGLLAWAGSTECDQTSDAMGMERRYGIFTGCLVADSDGRYFPLDQVRGNEEFGR